MAIEEARKKFFEAKTRIEDCQRAIAGLQNKHDTLEASLPELTQQIENAERVKQTALDSYVLHDDKPSESELRKARTAYEQAVKQQSETNELIESVVRTLKRQESELIKLNNAVDLARRECWQAVADEIKSAIPKHLFGDMKTLFVAGVQCCMTRQFLLDTLFPNLSSGEHQEIFAQLSKKYEIE